jgi:hypothetical protein
MKTCKPRDLNLGIKFIKINNIDNPTTAIEATERTRTV